MHSESSQAIGSSKLSLGRVKKQRNRSEGGGHSPFHSPGGHKRRHLPTE